MEAIVRAAGYLLFLGLMAPGYYYNVTFVQLGLHDLGVRVIGMGEREVAAAMGLLALVTAIAAVGTGLLMRRWQPGLVGKLRVAAAVVIVHTALAGLAPNLGDPAAFVGWTLVAGVSLGIGVPVTFGLAVDLVAVPHRGYVAAAITAVAYFAAAALAPEWRIDAFADQLFWPMLAGAIGLVIFSWVRNPLLESLAGQHARPEFAVGRFVRDGRSPNRLLLAYVVGLGAIFFIDSLGFLRLIFTPAIVADTWQSPEETVRWFIGGVHVLGAAIGGILYARLDGRTMLLWIFGIFALVQLMYVMGERTPSTIETTTLAPAMLYAVAVSLYTVVTFAVWADLSTPRTVGLNVALGIGLAGWLTTFASTALSLELRIGGVGVDEHLSWVAAIAMLAFLAVLGMLFFGTSSRSAPEPLDR
jgi:MFS family permease